MPTWHRPTWDMQVYTAINQTVLASIPTRALRVLDVGCGNGALGRTVKARRPAEVVGLTYSEEEARRAGDLVRVVVCDLNQFDPVGLGTFDCVVCSHVLE